MGAVVLCFLNKFKFVFITIEEDASDKVYSVFLLFYLLEFKNLFCKAQLLRFWKEKEK